MHNGYAPTYMYFIFVDCDKEPVNNYMLKRQVEALDSHVVEIATTLMKVGLVPIVVGGGHNNSFGLLTSVRASTGK